MMLEKRFCRRIKQCRGFTLLEVLVALGMVAVVLAAGVLATSALTRNAAQQSLVLLAHLCAENELVTIRLSQQMPDVGDRTVVCKQASRSLQMAVSVKATANPEFRRVDAQVSDSNIPILVLTTVVTRH